MSSIDRSHNRLNQSLQNLSKMSVIKILKTLKDVRLNIDGTIIYLPLIIPRISIINDGANSGFLIKFPDMVPFKFLHTDTIYTYQWLMALESGESGDYPAPASEAIGFLLLIINSLIDFKKAVTELALSPGDSGSMEYWLSRGEVEGEFTDGENEQFITRRLFNLADYIKKGKKDTLRAFLNTL